MASNFGVTKCVINNDEIDEELKVVTDKGIATILSFCPVMNRPDLEEYLNSGPSMVLVHNSCQRKFTDVRAYKRIKLQEEPTEFDSSVQLGHNLCGRQCASSVAKL